MITLSIDHKGTKKNTEKNVVNKVCNFIQNEFWKDEGLILYSLDYNITSKKTQELYKKAKSLPDSEWIDY